MAKSKATPVERQVSRVYRRLAIQSIVNSVIWCWVAATALTAVWFLVQPLVLEPSIGWLRWGVAGSAFALSTIVGVIIGWLRAPSRLAAALSLDSRFGLKERVTTSLSLSPQQATSAAGQALLADVAHHVKELDVRSRFPVRLSWTAALFPVCAGVLALIAVFYNPVSSQATAANKSDLAEMPTNPSEIQQKINGLRKKHDREKPPTDRVKPEDLAKLESELEKIANKPHDNKEQIRERIKEMTALEETMKNREKDLADRTRSLQTQLKQLDRLAQKDATEGPAKDLQKALSDGKFDKAREELDRLQKKLAKNELTTAQKEQLKKQLEDMQKKLERLAQLKDKEEKLKQAKLDPETLKREMDQLKKEADKLKGLQDLAQQLGQIQKNLKEGNMEGAMDSLSKAADKLKAMEGEDEDLQDLRDQLSRLQDAKDSC
jgi:hypothetical protein